MIPQYDSLDFSLLDSPVTLEEAEAYRRRQGAKWPLRGLVLLAAVLLIGLVVHAFLPSGMQFLRGREPLVVIASVVLLWRAGASWYSAKADVRMSRLADAAGLGYSAYDGVELAGAGVIFDIGRARTFRQTLYRQDQAGRRLFEIGRYQYTIGSGKNSRTLYWRYACVQLERRLPHMLLDATDNNARVLGRERSDLPVSFETSQTIQLEGDFNQYFTLYAPAGYDVDVRYVFTPDLMASLIDGAARYNVEVIDDKLYFYVLDTFGTDYRSVQKLLSIVGLIGQKLSDQTNYYTDDRAAAPRTANVVAEPGQRLRMRRWRISPLVLVIIITLLVIVPFVVMNVITFMALNR